MRTALRFVMGALLVAAGTASPAQLVEDLYRLHAPIATFEPRDTTSLWLARPFTPGQTQVSFGMGTGFTSMGRGMGFSSSYISPMVTYSPTARLQLQVGGRFSYANMNNIPLMPSSGATPVGVSNPTEAFAFGRYALTDRITLFGMGAFGQNVLYYSPFQRQMGAMSYQEFAVGMDYRIGRNATIGLSFGYTNAPRWGAPGLRRDAMGFPMFP